VGKPEERELYLDQKVGGWTMLKMDLREIGMGGLNWIYLAQDWDQ
jgi:hypothetical protein